MRSFKPAAESLETRDLCTVVHPLPHAAVHHPVVAIQLAHHARLGAAIHHWAQRRAAAWAPTPAFSYVDVSQNWGMHLNDSLGDCVPAAFANVEIVQAQATGHPFWPSDTSVLLAYARVSGYVPGRPETDRGEWAMAGIMDWERNGFDGHRARAWGIVNRRNHYQVERAVWLYGATVATVALPLDAVTQYKHGQYWDVTAGPTGAPYSAGGHEVAVFGWTPTGPLLGTWSTTVQATWAWWDTYVTENDAVLTYDWTANGVAPSGLNSSQLQNQLRHLT